MEDGSLWAAVVVDTMDDAKATVDRVARGVEVRRSQVGSHLGGGGQGSRGGPRGPSATCCPIAMRPAAS